jgi:hypothetical protein
MSAPTDQTSPAPGRRTTVTKAIAALAVAAAVAFGAGAITNSRSSAAAGTAPGVRGGPPGHAGAGMPPQMGTEVTGATRTKLTDVATAKYPGTVERAMQLPDGSYVVHVITSNGEVHVLVSKQFTVTGADTGGPPAGVGVPPAGAAAPGTTSQ